MSTELCVRQKAKDAGIDIDKFIKEKGNLKDKIEKIRNNAGKDKNYTLAAQRMLEQEEINLAKTHRQALHTVLAFSKQLERFKGTIDKVDKSSTLLRRWKNFVLGSGQRSDSIQLSAPNAGASFGNDLRNRFLKIVNKGKEDDSELQRILQNRESQVKILRVLMADENASVPKDIEKPLVEIAQNIYRTQKYQHQLLNTFGLETEELQGRGTAQIWNLEKFAGVKLAEGKKKFVDFLMNQNMDWEKSFPDSDTSTVEKQIKALEGTYEGFNRRFGGGEETNPEDIRTGTTSDKKFRSAGTNRKIFFKTAEGFYNTMQEYGHGDLYTALHAEMVSIGQKVGTASLWGPNPGLTSEMLLNEIRTNPNYNLNQEHVAELNRFTRSYIDMIRHTNAGINDLSWRRRTYIAKAFSTIKNIGGMFVRALGSDHINAMLTYSYRGFGGTRAVGNTAQALGHTVLNWLGANAGSDEFREIAASLGQGYETMQHMANEPGIIFDKYGKTAGTLAKYQKLVVKASGIKDHDKSLKTVPAVQGARYIGENAHLQFEQLNPKLQRWLNQFNITPKEWDIWRKNVPLNEEGIKNCLLPEVIPHKDLTATESLDLFNKSYQMLTSDYKNIVPAGLPDRMKVTMSHLPPGYRFVAENFLQFKGYAFNYYRLWDRAFTGSTSTAEKAFNIGALAVGQVAAGYISYNAYNMLQGKLVDNSPVGLISNVFLPALGIIGDSLESIISNPTQFVSSLAGPLVHTGVEMAEYLLKMGKLHFGFKSPRYGAANAKMLTAQMIAGNAGIFKTPIAMVAALSGLRKGMEDWIQPGTSMQVARKNEQEQRKRETESEELKQTLKKIL